MVQHATTRPQTAEYKLDTSDITKLTAHDCNLLQDLCNALTQPEEATDYMQGQNIITSSYAVPCVIGLKAALNNMVWSQL